MTADVAIEVRDLRKAYGPHEVVRGISFAVRRGEVFGLLGPNGAGKTTTVEILEGFRPRSGGDVAVLGIDPGGRPPALRERIGIVLQSAGLYRHLSAREAIRHWAGLYPAPRDVEARHEDRAGVGLQQRGEHPHRGRLPGAVGAEEPEHAARRNLEVDAVEGPDVAEGLRKAGHADRRLARVRYVHAGTVRRI